MKISRRMEWPEPRNLNTLGEISEYCTLIYKSLTDESGLRAGELDVAFTDGYNVILGHEAGISMAISLDDTEGVYDVFIGHQAGYSNTTGIKNIGIGYKPLYTNTTGDENTALGSEALYSNTSGANNVALGNNALYTNATGNYNVAIGFEALKVSTVSNNVALGYQALVANTSGANNIALGYQTLDANSTGAGNVAIGESALTANTTASFNLAVGYNALAANTDGHTNIAIGHSALAGNTSADYNIAIGYQTLDASNTGDNNIAIGFGSLGANTSGHENIMVGYEAGYLNESGYENIFLGYQAGYLNVSGAAGVGIGTEALYSCTVGNNTAVGYQALKGCTTGISNVAVGHTALDAVVTGNANVAIGLSSLGSNTSGYGNVGLGYFTLLNTTSGFQNTAVGADSLNQNISGDENVAVGMGAGAGILGNGNVLLGFRAGYNETGSNKLYIANSETATPLIGGVFPNTSLTFTSAATTFSGTLGAGNATLGTIGCGVITSTGTIQGTTARLTGLGTGYIPYHIDDATGLANSPIFTDGANIFIGGTSNVKMSQGVTIWQDAYDDEILAFKSSDVAHGCTDFTETDTYGLMKKGSADLGGLLIEGYIEDKKAIQIQARYTVDNTVKGTAGLAPIELIVQKISGTGVTNMGANANAVVMRVRRGGANISAWILDEDGDTWQDGNITLASATSTITGGTKLTLAAGADGICINDKFSLGAPAELTITAGAITVTKSYHTVDGQGDAADDLATINGGVDGMLLVLACENDARDITIVQTGNIKIANVGALVLGHTYDRATFIYDATATKWFETSRSING